MSEEAKTVELGDLLTNITKGTTPPRGQGFVDVGINYIKSECINYDGEIDRSKFTFIDDITHQKFKRSQIQEDDILFSMAGAYLGKNAIVKHHHLPANTNQAVAIIRVNKDKANPNYISYCLREIKMISYVNSMSAQSAQPNINFQEISSLPIRLPNLETQTKVVDKLLPLDQKIHLLRQQNATLESMAQALFKSWFVDFDPVIDNALAAGRVLPEALAGRVATRRAVLGEYAPLPEEVMRLFPDGFVFSEELGRWVPEGWEVKMLSQLGKKISKGTTPRKSDVEGLEEVIPFLKVRNLSNNGKIDINSLDMIPESVHYKQLKRSVLQSGDLLFSIAGTIGRVAIVPDQLENCNCNQALAFIRLKKEMLVEELVHQFLISHQTQHLVLSKIVQAVQANVSLTTLGELELVVPNKAILQYWKNSIIPYYKKMSEIDSQIQTLTRLRDVLLPELISGRVGDMRV